jgi:hypothetical protein
MGRQFSILRFCGFYGGRDMHNPVLRKGSANRSSRIIRTEDKGQAGLPDKACLAKDKMAAKAAQ